MNCYKVVDPRKMIHQAHKKILKLETEIINVPPDLIEIDQLQENIKQISIEIEQVRVKWITALETMQNAQLGLKDPNHLFRLSQSIEAYKKEESGEPNE